MQRKIDSALMRWAKQKDRKPLVLQGPRQVGKTFSLKAFGERNFSNSFYFNFEEDRALEKIFGESLDPKKILELLEFKLGITINVATDLILFDEIQQCPRALTSLKYFCEKMPQMAVCSAGSLLGVTLNQADFPVGKVEFLNMYPMSFEEFLRGMGDEKSYEFLSNLGPKDSIPETIHVHLWQQFIIYLVVGGLPEVVGIYRDHQESLQQALSLVRKSQENLILGYAADIAKHSGKNNSVHIDRVWKNVPAQLAREMDGTAPKYVFQGVIPGVQRYKKLAGPIDWLLAAGLIIKLQIINKASLPFSAFSKDNFFKLFMFDVGILGALSRLPVQTILDFDFGTYKGYLAENFVAQEFLCQGEDKLFGWREGKAEIEFVRERGGKIFPIEVKSGWVTQSKSLKVFSDKYGPDCRFTFSARNLRIDRENKFHHYPLYLAGRFPLLD